MRSGGPSPLSPARVERGITSLVTPYRRRCQMSVTCRSEDRRGRSGSPERTRPSGAAAAESEARGGKADLLVGTSPGFGEPLRDDLLPNGPGGVGSWGAVGDTVRFCATVRGQTASVTRGNVRSASRLGHGSTSLAKGDPDARGVRATVVRPGIRSRSVPPEVPEGTFDQGLGVVAQAVRGGFCTISSGQNAKCSAAMRRA